MWKIANEENNCEINFGLDLNSNNANEEESDIKSLKNGIIAKVISIKNDYSYPNDENKIKNIYIKIN